MKYKDNRGTVMLEAVYCILLVIFVFMFLLSFGFFLYQNTIFSIAANDIAEDVAHSYKYRFLEDTSVITASDISGVGKYRYLFHNNSFEVNNEYKLYNKSYTRLSKSSFANEDGLLYVNIDSELDDLGRRHYIVTLRQKYDFFLSDFLKKLGIAGFDEIEATVYVESYDVLNYVNTIKTTKYGLNKVKENSKVVKLLESAIKLLKSIFTTFS